MYNVYCQLTQKTNENASPSHPPPRFAAAAGQKLKLIGFSKFVRLGKQSTKLVDEISVHCEVIGPTCSISLFPSKIALHPSMSFAPIDLILICMERNLLSYVSSKYIIFFIFSV